jgi:hypothetical protein
LLLGLLAFAVPFAWTAVAAGACPPANQQLLQLGDLPPLVPPSGTRPLYTTALGLTQSYKEDPKKTQSDARQLTSNGFQAGAWEYLHGPHHTLKRAGLSNVTLLGSPQGAIAQMVADLNGPRTRLKREGLRVRTVTVPGIPGSSGFTVRPKRGKYYPGVNFWFTHGNYEYFVGQDGVNTHALGNTAAAAQVVYDRAVAAGC